MRSLSVAAGLAPGHVERIINGRTDPAHLELETVRRLAQTGQVSLTWLQTGDGPREVDAEPDRYPEREQVLAEYIDIDPEIRELVMGMQLLRGVKPSKAIWRSMIDGMIAAKARGERLTTPSAETENEVPPLARRQK